METLVMMTFFNEKGLEKEKKFFTKKDTERILREQGKGTDYLVSFWNTLKTKGEVLSGNVKFQLVVMTGELLQRPPTWGEVMDILINGTKK